MNLRDLFKSVCKDAFSVKQTWMSQSSIDVLISLEGKKKLKKLKLTSSLGAL